MRKILLWGRLTPGVNYGVSDILLKNRINSNSGNLLFNASVARTVMTDDVQFTSFFSAEVDKLLAQMDRLNDEYDSVVIPLANAFRPDYMQHLRPLTRFIRAAKLPCYVIGVGLEADAASALKSALPFDPDVQAFVRAVLEKSAMLGLRGEFTAQYLQKLGFRDGEHFRIIGCPSAYLRGGEAAQIRVKPLQDVKKACVGFDIGLSENVNALIRSGISEFDETVFIPQTQRELWFLYYGHVRSRYVRAHAQDFYPVNRSHPFYREDRMVGFASAESWIRYLEGRDFAFGTRIHGNMAATLAGVPAYVIAGGLRVRELAEYYGLPYTLSSDVKDGDSIRGYYEKADFGGFNRKYPTNFANYVDFLNTIGVRHIYQDAQNMPAWGSAPYDIAMREAADLPPVRASLKPTAGERLDLLKTYGGLLLKKIKR